MNEPLVRPPWLHRSLTGLPTHPSLGDPAMTSSSNLDPFEGLSEEEITSRLSEVPPGVATPAADAAPAAPAAAAPADEAVMTLAGRVDIDQQGSATASNISLEAAACLQHVGTELPNSVRPQIERARIGFLRSGHESRIGFRKMAPKNLSLIHI